VLGALTLFEAMSVRTLANKQREGANSLARQLVEQVRAVPYGQLNDNSIEQRMQALPGLSDSNDGDAGWQVKRGTTYTVTARTCTVDDPKDGVGANVGTDYCRVSTGSGCQSTIDVSGQASTPTTDVRLCLSLGGETVSTLCGAVGTSASGTIGGVAGGIGSNGSANVCNSSTRLDDNPNDYKLALFVVTWNDGQHRDRQATVIPNPGEGAGPAITSLTQTATTTGSMSFSAATTTDAASVQWSIDGSIQGRATLVGTAASFTWTFPSDLVDGTYIVGARAYDASGASGIARTLTVTINRGKPKIVTGFVAGRNGSIMSATASSRRSLPAPTSSCAR
jgi:hypothetical protein